MLHYGDCIMIMKSYRIQDEWFCDVLLNIDISTFAYKRDVLHSFLPLEWERYVPFSMVESQRVWFPWINSLVLTFECWTIIE